MMTTIRLLAALASLALFSQPTRALTELEQLRVQRQQIETSFNAEMRECAAKFQVTDCELTAKSSRRAALQPLLKQEQALDLAERQQRAQAQRERVASKQQAKAQEARLLAAKAASAPASPTAASRPVQAELSKPAASAAMAPRADAAAARALAASQAERARQATQRRIKAAQAHENEVLAREAAKTKQAAPLALPASALAR